MLAHARIVVHRGPVFLHWSNTFWVKRRLLAIARVRVQVVRWCRRQCSRNVGASAAAPVARRLTGEGSGGRLEAGDVQADREDVQEKSNVEGGEAAWWAGAVQPEAGGIHGAGAGNVDVGVPTWKDARPPPLDTGTGRTTRVVYQ